MQRAFVPPLRDLSLICSQEICILTGPPQKEPPLFRLLHTLTSSLMKDSPLGGTEDEENEKQNIPGRATSICKGTS